MCVDDTLDLKHFVFGYGDGIVDVYVIENGCRALPGIRIHLKDISIVLVSPDGRLYHLGTLMG